MEKKVVLSHSLIARSHFQVLNTLWNWHRPKFGSSNRWSQACMLFRCLFGELQSEIHPCGKPLQNKCSPVHDFIMRGIFLLSSGRCHAVPSDAFSFQECSSPHSPFHRKSLKFSLCRRSLAGRRKCFLVTRASILECSVSSIPDVHDPEDHRCPFQVDLSYASLPTLQMQKCFIFNNSERCRRFEFSMDIPLRAPRPSLPTIRRD